MSILDLQGLQAPIHKGPPPGSRTSKGCGTTNNESTLSLICNLL
jgi:Lanthionine-containing peptide SapB precursor RamS